MDLWIVRHGETLANVEKYFQGHSPGKLTENGILQAKALGLFLSDYEFDKIYSSDLNRCTETLAEILKITKYTYDITLSQRLREKRGGVLEGKSYQYMSDVIKKKNIPHRLFRPVDGENFVDIFIRVMSFLEDLIKDNIKDNFAFKKLKNTEEIISKQKSNENLNTYTFEEKISTEKLFEKVRDFKFVDIKYSKDSEEKNSSKNIFEEFNIKNILIQPINKVDNNLIELKDLNIKDKQTDKQVSVLDNDETQLFELQKKAESSAAVAQDDQNYTHDQNQKINLVLKKDDFNIDDFLSLGQEELEEKKTSFSEKKKKFDSIYKYKSDYNFKQFLIISHGGWITEFYRLIRQYKNLDADPKLKLKNTCLNLIRIYCSNCGGKCFKKSENCKVNIDIIFQNDATHLESEK